MTTPRQQKKYENKLRKARDRFRESARELVRLYCEDPESCAGLIDGMMIPGKADVSMFSGDIDKALNGKSKTEETDNIQNFVGRMRSWLRLYAAVTNHEISTLYA